MQWRGIKYQENQTEFLVFFYFNNWENVNNHKQ